MYSIASIKIILNIAYGCQRVVNVRKGVHSARCILTGSRSISRSHANSPCLSALRTEHPMPQGYCKHIRSQSSLSIRPPILPASPSTLIYRSSDGEADSRCRLICSVSDQCPQPLHSCPPRIVAARTRLGNYPYS